MLGSIKLVHVPTHIVVARDVVQVLLVDRSVVDRQSDTLSAESARTTDTMEVDLRVGDRLVVELDYRHVVVYHELRLGHVDTSCDHVGRDQHVDVLVPELLNGGITLLLGHLGEHDVGLEVVFGK